MGYTHNDVNKDPPLLNYSLTNFTTDYVLISCWIPIAESLVPAVAKSSVTAVPKSPFPAVAESLIPESSGPAVPRSSVPES